jgi:hypothetical protein
MRRLAPIALVPFALLACSSTPDGGSSGGAGSPASPDALAPPPKDQGFQLAAQTKAEPGEEIWKCFISDLPTSTFYDVNHVESVQNESMHHMDIAGLLFTGVDLDPGEYDCAPLYEKYPALMEEGLTIYAAQHGKQEIKLPEGVSANLPPALRVMHELHFVNTSSEPVDVFSKVNIYQYPKEKVTDNIWGVAVRDRNINIPPKSEHTEWTRCVMNEDIDVLFITSHTHQLARKTTIHTFDGKSTGPQIFENTEWQSPNLLSFTDKPLHVAKGQGFEFACMFQNTGDAEVKWGFKSTDEMCQIAVVFTPSTSTAECTVVETSDGVLPD